MNENENGGSKNKISQFYNDKSVFITGATGFMGKVNGSLLRQILNCELRCW
jgi:FlaA1/EpsC-like NDP-sugar epimerase